MSLFKRLPLMLLVLLGALVLVACGGGAAPAEPPTPTSAAPAGDVAAGDAKYHEVCVACHGPGGEGVTNLGKPFTTSEFLRATPDADLLTFIKSGRPSSDPANTTGIDMPPKGGNPALTDQQILDIIAYIRTLQQ